ncbi:MAG TPA: antitoxin VbhA family protein [Candidatus Gallacutalibacter pullicola]|uniref:Antitoxin VbhA family protein n=1 Tax=Candidatus Gallacutalibacter pullicola TaxID=2840830 RepID=A0A9D1DQZ6_9FIRM|nr:antitoxin VbhA family protein [Candidatus Gallacutalibacter pullicola]
MTQKNRKQIEYAVSTQALEKLIPSKEALRLCEQISDGEISANDAVSFILKQHSFQKNW